MGYCIQYIICCSEHIPSGCMEWASLSSEEKFVQYLKLVQTLQCTNAVAIACASNGSECLRKSRATVRSTELTPHDPEPEPQSHVSSCLHLRPTLPAPTIFYNRVWGLLELPHLPWPSLNRLPSTQMTRQCFFWHLPRLLRKQEEKNPRQTHASFNQSEEPLDSRTARMQTFCTPSRLPARPPTHCLVHCYLSPVDW